MILIKSLSALGDILLFSIDKFEFLLFSHFYKKSME